MKSIQYDRKNDKEHPEEQWVIYHRLGIELYLFLVTRPYTCDNDKGQCRQLAERQ